MKKILLGLCYLCICTGTYAQFNIYTKGTSSPTLSFGSSSSSVNGTLLPQTLKIPSTNTSTTEAGLVAFISNEIYLKNGSAWSSLDVSMWGGSAFSMTAEVGMSNLSDASIGAAFPYGSRNVNAGNFCNISVYPSAMQNTFPVFPFSYTPPGAAPSGAVNVYLNGASIYAGTLGTFGAFSKAVPCFSAYTMTDSNNQSITLQEYPARYIYSAPTTAAGPFTLKTTTALLTISGSGTLSSTMTQTVPSFLTTSVSSVQSIPNITGITIPTTQAQDLYKAHQAVLSMNNIKGGASTMSFQGIAAQYGANGSTATSPIIWLGYASNVYTCTSPRQNVLQNSWSSFKNIGTGVNSANDYVTDLVLVLATDPAILNQLYGTLKFDFVNCPLENMDVFALDNNTGKWVKIGQLRDNTTLASIYIPLLYGIKTSTIVLYAYTPSGVIAESSISNVILY